MRESKEILGDCGGAAAGNQPKNLFFPNIRCFYDSIDLLDWCEKFWVLRGEMQVIFNGDDFGRSAEINRAILQAHEQGVLTSASLMVSGAAFREAVEIARQHPSLAVGLHLVLVHGQAALRPSEIPHLVDGQGRFRDDPVQAGIYYFFNSKARQELACEIEAQFERFAETRLPFSHVDGHLHMHVHPVVFQSLLPLAAQYRVHGVRLPRDDFWLAMRHSRRALGIKLLWAIVFGLLARWCDGQVRGYRLFVPQRVYGLMQSGDMQEAYVLDVLRHVQSPSAELYFHPTLEKGKEHLGANRTDLQALLSPAVQIVLKKRGIERVNYFQLTPTWDKGK